MIQEENAGQRKPWERKLPNTPEVKGAKIKEIYIPVHLSTKFVSSNCPAHQIPAKGGFLTSKGQLFRRSPPKRNKGPLLAGQQQQQQQQSNLQGSKKAIEIPPKKNSDHSISHPQPTSNSQIPKASPHSGIKSPNPFPNDPKPSKTSPNPTKSRPTLDRTGSSSTPNQLSPTLNHPKSNPNITPSKDPKTISRKTSKNSLKTITEKSSTRKPPSPLSAAQNPDPKKPFPSKRGSKASIGLISAHSNKSLSKDKIVKLSPCNIPGAKKWIKNFVGNEGEERENSPCFFFHKKSED
jgi:hypothetical protein